MSRNALRALLDRLLAAPLAQSGARPQDLDESTDLLMTGLLDSFQFLDLLAAIEVEGGVAVDLDELPSDGVGRLGGLLDVLGRKAGA